MMMMPSIFGGNLFNDDWMDFSFPDIDKELYGNQCTISMVFSLAGKTIRAIQVTSMGNMKT